MITAITDFSFSQLLDKIEAVILAVLAIWALIKRRQISEMFNVLFELLTSVRELKRIREEVRKIEKSNRELLTKVNSYENSLIGIKNTLLVTIPLLESEDLSKDDKKIIIKALEGIKNSILQTKQ